ncbi:MAG: helicase-related protein, partial [Candidatus Ratteibacteria bacterium]
HGIENYSRHLAGRLPGERPECLLDYFPSDYLMFIDESHMTIPQIRGMHAGDRSRKETLIEYGFRLPSAIDNRPLTFEEFESMINQVICVSATPGVYELEKIGVRKLGEKSDLLVEQVIRPTGLIDPPIRVLPTKNQLDDLVVRIRERVRKKQRVLVLTISKQLAEQLTDYLKDLRLKVMYLHYEIDTLERMEILKKLREATFDVLVGINLLREGLDLPEVSLVAILDADKEGFLRSERSLIQIAGRASRSIDGEVIMYADKITDAMKAAIDETERRRAIQQEYNRVHNITPKQVIKPIYQTISDIIGSKSRKQQEILADKEEILYGKNLAQLIRTLEKKMMAYAKQLDFETAIKYREKIKRLKNEK